jgi:hypothetical protein
VTGQISTSNYTIGQVALYFNATIADTTLLTATFLTATNSLGNIVTSEISPNVTYIEHYITDDGKRRKDFQTTGEINLTIPFTFDEMNSKNIQRFFLGSLLATDKIAPFEEPLKMGSAVLKFTTEVGQDMVYYIPKCTLRPDGALGINPEEWWTGPMVLDVLYYGTSHWALRKIAPVLSNLYSKLREFSENLSQIFGMATLSLA